MISVRPRRRSLLDTTIGSDPVASVLMEEAACAFMSLSPSFFTACGRLGLPFRFQQQRRMACPRNGMTLRRFPYSGPGNEIGSASVLPPQPRNWVSPNTRSWLAIGLLGTALACTSLHANYSRLHNDEIPFVENDCQHHSSAKGRDRRANIPGYINALSDLLRIDRNRKNDQIDVTPAAPVSSCQYPPRKGDDNDTAY